MTSGRSFARNSALNLLGMVLPLVVAVVCMPLLIRGLGPERFGILTLAWAAVGYFGLFEFGLGRALTQAVAHRIGVGQERELPTMVWTALLLLTALGVVGAVFLAAATEALVNSILNVPEVLRGEAVLSFYILAASLPFVVSTAGLRGLMEAHQHFGMANALRAPLIAFTFVGPVLALPFSKSLVPAVALLVAGRVIGWAAHLLLCLRAYPYLREGVAIRGQSVGPLLRFGGWTTLTNLVSPMMVFLDRFLIGALLPIAAVAHYVTPYEVVTKMLLIPASILAAMFPAFAATFANDRERMGQLYDRALRAVVLLTFPVLLVIVGLAPEGMNAWMGRALPPESTTILQWLAIGMFINGIGQAPFAALQGAGRPDLIAKLHLLELPIYVVSIFALVGSMGLVGVAVAWTLRVAVDAVALLYVARRALAFPLAPTRAFAGMLLLVVLLAGAALPGPTSLRIGYVLVVGGVFVLAASRRLLTAAERSALLAWARSGRGVAAPPSEEPA